MPRRRTAAGRSCRSAYPFPACQTPNDDYQTAALKPQGNDAEGNNAYRVRFQALRPTLSKWFAFSLLFDLNRLSAAPELSLGHF